jgi:hypothetical protein
MTSQEALVHQLRRDLVVAHTSLMLAQLDLASERRQVEEWRKRAQVENDLRGWLRLCSDDPKGHGEFYAWASHLYFGTPPPEE